MRYAYYVSKNNQGVKMFTHTTNRVITCQCGSTSVAKRYTTDFTGEVDGVRYTCRDCGASETF